MRLISPPCPSLRALLALAIALAAAPVAAAPNAPASGPGAAVDPPADAVGAAMGERAAREIAWYTAEVPVRSQEAREREAALGRALAQVFVRVTGRVDAPGDPVLQKAVRVADTLLVETAYRQMEELAGGVPVPRELLVASFDPDAVDALVMAAGLPLWSGERPRPLLWLAIDDGGGAGPRLVSAQQINVVKPLAERGLERGVRFLLPAGTTVEQAAAARLWALDAAAAGVLSSRYGARFQLVGRISRAGAGWQADWLLAEAGVEIKRWSQADPSPQRAIASGAARSADALAARQARAVPAGQPVVVEAEIVGVDGRDRWLGLSAYLQSLPVLRGMEVLEAHPDRLRLRLDLAVDRQRFEALLASGRRLAVEPQPGEPLPAGVADPSLTPDASRIARYRLLP